MPKNKFNKSFSVKSDMDWRKPNGFEEVDNGSNPPLPKISKPNWHPSTKTKIYNDKFPKGQPERLKLIKWESTYDNKKYIIRAYGHSPADAIGYILDIFENKSPYDFSKMFVVNHPHEKITEELANRMFMEIFPSSH